MNSAFLTLILTSFLYILPMAIVFMYACYIITCVEYPEEDTEVVSGGICPTCHNRKRSEKWIQYAKIGEFMMTPQNMPKKGLFNLRKSMSKSSKSRRASADNIQGNTTDSDDLKKFQNIKELLRNIHSKKRSSGISIEENPEKKQSEIVNALLEQNRNSLQFRKVERKSTGDASLFKKELSARNSRRNSNLGRNSFIEHETITEVSEVSSEGWLSSVVTPIGRIYNLAYSNDEENDEESIENDTESRRITKNRVPKPQIKPLGVDPTSVTIEMEGAASKC